jgi:hypothetical protein
VHDIKHFTALILEKEFKDDPDWKEFVKLAAETRQSIHQTEISFVEPPSQRTKSRYMNMEILVDWGMNVLALLERLTNHQLFSQNGKTIEEKLGWVARFKQPINEWKQVMNLVETTEHFVRTRGIYRDCDKELRRLLPPLPGKTERIYRIRCAFLDGVLNESLKARPGEKLLGSSEVVESVLGKFKHIQDVHVRGSITGLVLAIPAMVSRLGQDVVRRALETVPVQEVRTWVRSHFGKSPRTQRRMMLSGQRGTEQKKDQMPGLA